MVPVGFEFTPFILLFVELSTCVVAITFVFAFAFANAAAAASWLFQRLIRLTFFEIKGANVSDFL